MSTFFKYNLTRLYIVNTGWQIKSCDVTRNTPRTNAH